MTSLPLVWSDRKTLVVSILVFTSPKVSSASGACSLQVSCSSSILCCCHRRCCSCSSCSLASISSSCTLLSSSCNIFHTSSCSTVAGGRVGRLVAKEASFLATLKKDKIILSLFQRKSTSCSATLRARGERIAKTRSRDPTSRFDAGADSW